jgi:hypothetical protein
MAISTAHLDYLQRTELDLSALAQAARVSPALCTAAPPELRRLWRVVSIGGKDTAPQLQYKTPFDPASRDIVVGLYGEKIPLAFLVSSGGDGLSIQVGTWSATNHETTSAAVLDERAAIVQAAVLAAYPGAKVAGVLRPRTPTFPLVGLALGIPTVRPPDVLDHASAIDRLARAIPSGEWGFLVLSEPVDEATIRTLRNACIHEWRNTEVAEQSGREPSPLTKLYLNYLDTAVKALSGGLEIGLWRTGVYVLGTRETYSRLAGLWRGLFSGEESVPEPIRVSPPSADSVRLAEAWALPDAAGLPGPGAFRYPLQYQTMLTSRQLAAYIQLPRLETAGFAVKLVPQFDVVPPDAAEDAIELGSVVSAGQVTHTRYAIDRDSLTRHALIAGITGSGKTNTVFHLLRKAHAAGVQFLVLEPAKAEYRALLEDPEIGATLRVFTLGSELIAPFRLNPFEVVGWPRLPIGVHIDLLRSAFSASFGMWAPLPQILEQALHAIYRDRGWDVATNHNDRLDAGSNIADAFPTLSELTAKSEEVIQTLGYEGKVTDDLRAALLTRLNGLRAGGKGAMLDVQRSYPMDELLAHPTVLELQSMGDDDDTAFVLGLLLVRLYEYRRAGKPTASLKHIIVFEEAHRLLAQSSSRSGDDQADPHGKAVSAFANVLAEIRAYGQGIIVIDQTPVKLAPDVIKNTALKIAHKVVANDDRAALAGAMAMTDGQARALATLERGHAAVFGANDDAPVLVEFDKAKSDDTVDDALVIKRMMSIAKAASNADGLSTRFASQELANDPEFKRDFVRLVVSMTEDASALDRLWGDLASQVRRRIKGSSDSATMLRDLITRTVDWFAKRRGAQERWSYGRTAELRDRLLAPLMAKIEGHDTRAALRAFQEAMLQLCARDGEPFTGCAKVCTQSPAVCLYRRAVEDMVAQGKERRFAEWTEEYRASSERAYALSGIASFTLIDGAPALAAAARRARLCYVQHMLAPGFPEIHRATLEEMLLQASGAEQHR